MNVTFDNLGGNVGLGFAQSFAAKFFCRMCLCTKDETKKLCTAAPEMYRNQSNYEEAIRIIENSSKIDLQATKGVSEFCVLNNLECFNILKNWTGDIMHDLCEGTIKFLLANFFEFGVKEKVFKSDNDYKILISNYDFGILNRQFIPSLVKVERKNLNQNASQMKCLMQHIPFIFNKFKDHPKLKNVWVCINTMVNILRICYSNTISEQNLDDLDELVKSHLKQMLICFRIDLKPKHHFMTHYSEIMRRSGPICHMSTLRFEMNHKMLTTAMKNCNNYKNVTKTITDKHLHKNVFKDVFTDHIVHTKLRKVDERCSKWYSSLLTNFDDLTIIYSVKNLRFNSDYYEKGLILKHNLNYLEIEEILCIDSDFYFVCTKFDRIGFNEFLVSLEINKSNPVDRTLIKHSDLIYSKSHDKKMYADKIFILSDSLEIE